jgi:hypothetical protein
MPGRPWRLRPSRTRFVISPRIGYASRPNGQLTAEVSHLLDLQPCWLLRRDRGTARATLGQGLAVSAFPLLRARLALSIAHVSVRPPCHPGRSHLASPVGDHDYPCAIFPDSLWLKRSLAYAPGAKGLPRSSAAVCRPNYAGAESGMSDTSTTRHDREPLRTLEVLPLG